MFNSPYKRLNEIRQTVHYRGKGPDAVRCRAGPEVKGCQPQGKDNAAIYHGLLSCALQCTEPKSSEVNNEFTVKQAPRNR